MKRRRLRAEDFTVGWICALPIESDAARAVLDEEYEDIEELAQYTLGRIGRHDVVIVYLPAGQIGTNSAAVAVAQMQSRFPAVAVSLMVGVGAGVPSREADVRLGDVVISQPQGSYGGVVQYDLGKTLAEGQRCRTGFLNAPPPTVLSAVAKLRSNLSAGRNDVQAHLSPLAHISAFSPHMTGPDILFDSSYNHVGGATCEQCLDDRIVPRTPRGGNAITVHYGTIASGNQVIKDGRTRDTLSSELGGVLCFEMEAAGLMNHTPCLVIRGICDYADSHKNKRWQPFAAATAAACAKAILLLLPAAFSVSEKKWELPEIGTSYPHPNKSYSRTDTERKTGSNTSVTAGDIDANVAVRHTLSSPQPIPYRKYLESLKFDQIDARHANIKTAHAKTCKWLLSTQEYQRWLNIHHLSEHHGFLWIKGKPGSGKSTMIKYLLGEAEKSMKDSVVISFFFNARGEDKEKSTLGMYQSLLLQLCEKLPDLQQIFDVHRATAANDGRTPKWTIELVRRLFQNAVRRISDRSLVCFIDALDECDEDQIREMVNCFRNLGQLEASVGTLWTCFASRHYPHISIEKSITLILEDQTEHRKDIAHYLQTELKAGYGQLVCQIRDEILERSGGVFLWVVLVVQMLNKEYDHGRLHALRKRLDTIPDGLENLLKDILARDDQHMEELVLCLQWVLYAIRPLKPQELYYAILAGAEPESLFVSQHEVPAVQDMERFLLSASKGLAQVTKAAPKTVQFIHESVRDFLLSENGLDSLHCGPKSTFAARSHEELKRCCQTYLTIDFSGHIDLVKPLPYTQEDSTAKVRKTVERNFPFLQYATKHVLEHAEAAASLGWSQLAFIEEFPPAKWIIIESLYRRWYPDDASILSILTEQNLPNLIETELNRFSDADTREEYYHYPLLAAMFDVKKKPRKALPAPTKISNTSSSMAFMDAIFSVDYDSSQTASELSELYCMGYSEIDGTALLRAVQSSEMCLTKVLLHVRKADGNARNIGGHPSWSRAVLTGHENIMETLSEQPRIDLNSVYLSAPTSLGAAAEEVQRGMVKLPFVRDGIDGNNKFEINLNALSTATKRGYEGVMSCLAGAIALSTHWKRSGTVPKSDVEIQDDHASTRLEAEARALQLIEPPLELLIQNQNVKDQTTPTAWSADVMTGDNALQDYQMQLMLLEQQHEDRLKIAQYSEEPYKYLEIIKLLLETRKVDEDEIDASRRIATIAAAHSAVDEVVRLLFVIHFSPQFILYRHHLTAIQIALGKCAKEVRKLLLATEESSSSITDQTHGSALTSVYEMNAKKTTELLSDLSKGHCS